MNLTTRLLSLAVLCLASLALSHAQGTFQNLNFEAANVPVVPFGQFGADVTVSNGLPGWNAYIGSAQVDMILHNDVSLGGAATISILGPQWGPSSILEGSYTVSLEPTTQVTTSIAQTGKIPPGAQSLRFYGDGGYSVSFLGQQVPLFVVGTTPNYQIFAGDISSFVNQTGELKFQGGGRLDNISFSGQPVPEPRMIALLLLGLTAFVWRGKRLTGSWH